MIRSLATVSSVLRSNWRAGISRPLRSFFATRSNVTRVPLLPDGKSYDELYGKFSWRIPELYNIGVDVCDKHASAKDAVALICAHEEGKRVDRVTFGQLKELSDQLAVSLRGLGLQRGEVVGILLSQGLETALAHIAVHKIGAIAMPLFTQFGPDALEYRIHASKAAAVITDVGNVDKITAIRAGIPAVRQLVVTDPARPGEAKLPHSLAPNMHSFWELLEKAKGGASGFRPAATRAVDPAVLIFTSGTTGQPKGALHAQQVLLGHLPGVEFPHNLFPRPLDAPLVFYTPADWAWIGGLFDVLLPALHYGVPVLAHRAKKFDPEQCMRLMTEHRVTNTFMPPTALKLMRQAGVPAARTALRSVGCGGEPLGAELLDWGRKTFGVTINEFYGQTEANLLIGNCAQVMPVQPGVMGRPIPGHRVAVVNDEGQELGVGETGNIAVARPDPVVFLRYLDNPAATKAKFAGDWLLTGDLGRREADGFFRFVGRSDDLIKSAGYRIGPAEVEDCLMKHPDVAMAAVIGVPDETRGEIVKAFLVLRSTARPSEALKETIQKFVKQRLAAYEYPRELEFVFELPMTTTGKIQRKVLREREISKIQSKRG